jgi:hypothetical protein
LAPLAARKTTRDGEPSLIADQDDLRQRAIAWVERSCAEQGVPVKLSDPQVLERIAKIFEEGRRTSRNSRRA